jgi:hypothetical protein
LFYVYPIEHMIHSAGNSALLLTFLMIIIFIRSHPKDLLQLIYNPISALRPIIEHIPFLIELLYPHLKSVLLTLLPCLNGMQLIRNYLYTMSNRTRTEPPNCLLLLFLPQIYWRHGVTLSQSLILHRFFGYCYKTLMGFISHTITFTFNMTLMFVKILGQQLCVYQKRM